MDRPKTLLLDIDGVLVKHHGNLSEQILQSPVLLPGVLDKINEWNAKNYYIILITGRKESMRSQTERMLSQLGVFYDQLIMGVTNGQRVIINDLKPNSNEPTALAITVERNQGLEKVCL